MLEKILFFIICMMFSFVAGGFFVLIANDIILSQYDPSGLSHGFINKSINNQYGFGSYKFLERQYDIICDNIVGQSMNPFIINKDCVLIVYDFTDEEISPGNIIIFNNNKNMSIMHRIVSVNGTEIITRGDNNMFQDEIVNKGEVKALVLGIFFR